MSNQGMGSFAASYAKRGWRILPLYEMKNGYCACGKTECNAPGKHQRINEKNPLVKFTKN